MGAPPAAARRTERPGACGLGKFPPIRISILKKNASARFIGAARRWAHRKQPQRIHATYRRLGGTEQFLAFYDVHAYWLNGVFRRRKRVREVAEAFVRLRRCYPRRRLFVILDNLHNVHDHPGFLTLLRRLRIHPVWTPTEASWLNLIEAQFGVLKRFTIAHTDDSSHAARRRRIYRYLHYRHRQLRNLNHPFTTPPFY